MYTVSDGYLSAVRSNVVTDRLSGTVTLTDGTVIEISDDIIIKDSVKLTKELCGEKYRIGTFNLASLKITYIDDYALNRNYSDAKIVLNYELLIDAEDEVWESVPLGIFVVDGTLTRRKRDKITLTAYDYGVYFDNEPSETIRAMSSTPAEIITAICSECGVAFGGFSDDFANMDVVVSLTSTQLQTNRDIIMWISALLCGYATIDRMGALRIIRARYAQIDTTITVDRHIYSDERDSIYVTDTRAYIKYMSAYSDGEIKQYVSNFDAEDTQAAPAAYSLSKNPLLNGKSADDCDRINLVWLEYIDNFMQRGIEAKIYGDPAIDVGDTIRCHEDDVDQRLSIVGVITRYEWCYRNYAYIYCSAPQCASVSAETGTTGVSSDIKSQTDKRIDSIAGGGNASGGASYNNCIIIADTDSDYLLHTYTQVDYIAGNRIGYGGASNNIVCNGYVFSYKSDANAPILTSAPYGSVSFGRVNTSLSSAPKSATYYYNIMSASPSYYGVKFVSNEMGYSSPEYGCYDMSISGFYPTWQYIYPPNSNYPYGYIYGILWASYKASAAAATLSSRIVQYLYVGFSSEAEYNAAIGLTYEPNTLRAVHQTITAT